MSRDPTLIVTVFRVKLWNQIFKIYKCLFLFILFDLIAIFLRVLALISIFLHINIMIFTRKIVLKIQIGHRTQDEVFSFNNRIVEFKTPLLHLFSVGVV